MRVAIIGKGALAAAIERACNGTAGVEASVVADAADGPDVDVTVVALEVAPISSLLAVGGQLLRAGRPALFVTVEGPQIVAGPVVAPGLSACVECRLRATMVDSLGPDASLTALAELWVGSAESVPSGTLEEAAVGVAQMLARLTEVLPGRRPFTGLAIFSPEGLGRMTVLPSGACTSCPTAAPVDSPVARAALAELAECLELEVLEAELGYSPAPVDHPDRYRTVGVLGGGTAGYLTALALRTKVPGLEVTIIESSKIPIISVGEATTPDLVKFLHSPALLGIDVVDFHRQVRPTFKLGVQFVWGPSDRGGFSYPFQYAPLVDPARYDDDTDTQSVSSFLMALDKAPVIEDGNGSIHSLLETVRFAYHLDNESFVLFLREECARRGIAHIDTTITDAVPTADGEEIAHLLSEDGRELAFDLYVDASGFRSVLMEGALGSPFRSFGDSLFTDSAIAANEPHGGVVKPYTRAETMDDGWCWTIPFEESDHIGYVYSSRFCDPDEALEQMRRAHPGMGEHRHITFRSGRHEHFFKGNVVAIGNAYGFVEPLESTALHMVIRELEHLTNHFPLKHDRATKDGLNRTMNELWDELRWFLAIHYRFNERRDTEFWRSVWHDTDISGAEERMALFRERAPLSDRPSLFYPGVAPDFFAGDHAYDSLLLGQRVEGRLGPNRTPRPDWDRKVALRRRIAEQAMGQAEALPLLRDQETALRRFTEAPWSWVHGWVLR